MKMNPNLLIKILAWLCNLGLWLICLLPLKIHVPAPITRSDLFYHGLSYMIVGLLYSMAYPRRIYLTSVLLIIQGIAIEFIQPFTGRFFEYYDMIANSIGVLISVLIAHFILRNAVKKILK